MVLMASPMNRLTEAPRFSMDMVFAEGIRLHWNLLDTDKVYRAEFWKDEDIIHKIFLRDDGIYTPLPRYIVPWHVKVFEDDVEIYSEVFSLKDKTVFIKVDSGALGDVLSWMGQIINFKKEWQCRRVYIKFGNWATRIELLDKERYKADGIFFREHTIECRYYIKICMYLSIDEPYSNSEWHKNKWNQIALGEVAADLMGITYIETRPYMSIEYKALTTLEDVDVKSIVIGPEASGPGMKHWQRDAGWQHLIDWHVDNGYTVFYSGLKNKDEHGYKNVITLPSDLKSAALAMVIGCNSCYDKRYE